VRRTYRFVEATQMVTCRFPSGRHVTVPAIPGIMKHPPPERLPELLRRPEVVEKYTSLALAKAAWPILRQFPRVWLRTRLDVVPMRRSRRRALVFLLS
jgi:hypothetical protein